MGILLATVWKSKYYLHDQQSGFTNSVELDIHYSEKYTVYKFGRSKKVLLPHQVGYGWSGI